MAKSTGPKPPEKPRAAAPRARRTEPKPALKLVVPVPVPAAEPPALLTLRKKDLVERVCTASGLPLGKARVNKQTGVTGDEVLVVKLRRPPAAAPGGSPAPDPDEDDN